MITRISIHTLMVLLATAPLAATTYYVSSSSGSDSNNGVSPTTAFETLAHINSMQLMPGDEVRLLCGDTWRADPLILTRSGASASPIVISSYPDGCSNRPVLSGALPVSGWVSVGTNLWVADLGAGANAGRFPNGLNQLFRGASRLPFGRWPDLAGHPDGGYAEVDSAPAADQIVDAALPAVNWSGAMLHIKGIRWYILNREVVADSGSTLTLNDDLSCWYGCAQWGYFLSNHLSTLSVEGEWFWDDASNSVYLYSSGSAPADGEIEGSAMLEGDGDYLGAIILGRHLWEHISYVDISNLVIERWFANGITTPTNLEADENCCLTIRDNLIRDVDDTGIRLTTWVWDAAANGNGPDGWRGGRHQVVRDNLIVRANHYGIDTYSRLSTFEDNTIIDVGRIPFLGASGLGCGTTGTNCTENGAGIRVKRGGSSPDHSGHSNTLLGNHITRVGMNGIDVFGYNNALINNVISWPCYTKGDCGGIRTFGNDNLGATHVHDLSIVGNLVLDTLGNTDGTHPDFEPLFGLGIYIDNYSRDVEVRDNTIAGSTAVGLLYQRSTGTATGNVVYDNGTSGTWGAELRLAGAQTAVSSTDNVFFAIDDTQRTVVADEASNLVASDNNAYFSPYRDASLSVDGSTYNLAGWQTASGMDGSSFGHWYLLDPDQLPWSELFINDTASPMSVDPLGTWRHLDQSSAAGGVVLDPHTSVVLVREEVLFQDDFETGDTERWSAAVP